MTKFQELPPEILEKIYRFLILLTLKRCQLVPYLRINKTAHAILAPHFFETLDLLDGNRGVKAVAALEMLPEPARSNCVKRVTMNPRIGKICESGQYFDILPLILSSLHIGAQSIERLSYFGILEPSLMLACSQLRNLRHFEAPVEVLCALSKLARSSSWGESIRELTFKVFSDRINDFLSLDLRSFPNLTRIALKVGDVEIARHLPPILNKAPTVGLVVVFPTRHFPFDASLGCSDSRVVYYQRYPDYDTKLEEFLLQIREIPYKYLGFKGIGEWTSSYRPGDDWGEITHCQDLHFWEWAERAREEGKNTFTRPYLL
ncbi:hypothetical protein DL96DRAFT_1679332 [Flagelloscypha sp. PMI_526]|nr:hypothetical protein DL96DRAFT_1679332 [Flagelloscypha sp. PMI_526]